MTLTEMFSAELRSLVMGPGTNYPITSPIDGLFTVPLLSDDLVADDRMSPGTDRLAVRVLAWRLAVMPDDGDITAESAADLLSALVTAWRRSSADLPLDVLIPGATWPRRFYGRPRLPGGVNIDLLSDGHAALDVVFMCSDPLGYGDEDTAAAVTAGDFKVATVGAADAGDLGADSPRVTLTITGTGGTPQVWHSPSGAELQFAAALPDTHVAVIDCLTGAVTIQGFYVGGALTAASVLPKLTGGVVNTFTMTGATAMDVDYRPAFW